MTGAIMAGKLATIFDKAAKRTAKQCGKAHTFERRLLLFVPHEHLQGCQAHMLICLMCSKGMPEGMHAHPFSNSSLFHVFGDNRLDGGDVEGRAVYGKEEHSIVQDELCCPVAK